MAKSAPGQFLFDGNGHVYEYIAAPGITWEKAHVLAASKRFKDSRGYLANVTSQAELDFLETVVIPGGAHTANIYLGGQQISPGKWVWLRGPENGTVFWNNGSVGAFAPWDTIYALSRSGPASPNANGSPYLYLNSWHRPYFTSSGGAALSSISEGGNAGYLVEYSEIKQSD